METDKLSGQAQSIIARVFGLKPAPGQIPGWLFRGIPLGKVNESELICFGYPYHHDNVIA
jgi:hypothetical protein